MEKLIMEKGDTSSKKTCLATIFPVIRGSSCYMHL